MTTDLPTLEQPTRWQRGLLSGLIGVALCLLIVLLWPQMGLTASIFAGEKAAWYLVRSSGVVAYLLLSASVLWGLLLSTQLSKTYVSPVISLALHNYLSWLSIGTTLVHASALLFDTYYAYTFGALLIPFTGPYMPFYVGLGTLGFYIMLLTTLSVYVKGYIGQKPWRMLHYTTFLGYIFATLHGIVAGTDAALLGTTFGVSGLLVLFLTLYRILNRH